MTNRSPNVSSFSLPAASRVRARRRLWATLRTHNSPAGPSGEAQASLLGGGLTRSLPQHRRQPISADAPGFNVTASSWSAHFCGVCCNCPETACHHTQIQTRMPSTTTFARSAVRRRRCRLGYGRSALMASRRQHCPPIFGRKATLSGGPVQAVEAIPAPGARRSCRRSRCWSRA